MNESIITALLVAIVVGLGVVAWWAVTRRNTGCATGGNASGDAHALSADSATAIVARQIK
ncbi:MAG: hypothetical protein JNM76_15975 [Betaproteobacteria bacterium]|nr:hypothetical protein [Betaproteobacteria bacterium]